MTSQQKAFALSLPGNLKEMEITVDAAKKLQAILDVIIIKNTNITKKQLKDVMGKDSYFSAKDALELGIVDRTITSPSSFYKNINI